MAGLFKAPTANFSSTSLNGAINDSVDTFTLNSVTGLQSPGYLIIDRQDANSVNTPNSREVVKYTGISGSDLTGVTRGADTSTARSHSDGALVEPMFTIGMHNDQRDAINAEHDTDGTHAAVTATTVDIGSSVAVNETLDEDDMVSDSATAIATQQSIKAYSDSLQPMTTEGDTIYGAGSGVPTRLAKGTATEVLTMNSGATAPEWSAAVALTSKVVTLERDMTAATGDVSTTGVGFIPTSIVATSQLVLADSQGYSDSTKAGKCIARLYDGAETVVYSALMFIHQASGAHQTAIVKTYDADGFTLTWTKGGTPTGTGKIVLICYK